MSTRCLKIVLLAIPLIGATYFFGMICHEMDAAYRLFLFPSGESLLLLLRMLLALGIVAVGAGIVAVLVRPLWSAFIVFSLSGAALLLGWEIAWHSIALTVLYVVVGTAYVVGTENELRQRIKFSVRSVSEGQGVLLAVLLIVALGSLALGYHEHIRREGFSIPENYVSRTFEEVARRIALRAPVAEREAVQSEVRQQFRHMLDYMLQRLEPFERFLPLALTLSLFMPLWTITRLLSWIPMLILGGVFPFLRAVGIAKVTAETLEVKRLVLG